VSDRTGNTELLNVWLQGALASSVYVLSRQAKLFSRGMCNVVSDLLCQQAEADLRASDLVQAAENYRRVEEQLGVVAPGTVQISPEADGIQVVVIDCVYGEPCGEILNALRGSGRFNEQNMPCLHVGCYDASCANQTGMKCRYRIIQAAPGVRCTIAIAQL